MAILTWDTARAESQPRLHSFFTLHAAGDPAHVILLPNSKAQGKERRLRPPVPTQLRTHKWRSSDVRAALGTGFFLFLPASEALIVYKMEQNVMNQKVLRAKKPRFWIPGLESEYKVKSGPLPRLQRVPTIRAWQHPSGTSLRYNSHLSPTCLKASRGGVSMVCVWKTFGYFTICYTSIF